MARTYEEEARRFWEETLGPNPTKDQIDAELHDFYVVIGEVSKVYDEITGGRFSKPTTMAVHITSRVEELLQEAVTEAEQPLKERIAQLEAEIAQARSALAVYADPENWSNADTANPYTGTWYRERQRQMQDVFLPRGDGWERAQTALADAAPPPGGEATQREVAGG